MKALKSVLKQITQINFYKLIIKCKTPQLKSSAHFVMTRKKDKVNLQTYQDSTAILAHKEPLLILCPKMKKMIRLLRIMIKLTSRSFYSLLKH